MRTQTTLILLCSVLGCSGSDSADPPSTATGSTTGTASGGCLESCDDGLDCTADACVDGACDHQPLEPGTPCDGGLCEAGGVCASGAHRWSRLLGSGIDGGEFATAAQFDAAGNIGLGGNLFGTGSVDFGTGPISDGNAFIVRMDGDGTTQWVKALPRSLEDVAVASDGGVVFIGTSVPNGYSQLLDGRLDNHGSEIFEWIDGSWTFSRRVAVSPEGPSVHADGFGIAKLGETGQLIWGRPFIPKGGAAAMIGVTVAPSGDIVALGEYWQPLDVGLGPMPVEGQAKNFFVAKFDAGGSPVWALHYPGASPSDVCTDGAGNVIVAGWLDAAIDFGEPLVPKGPWSSFILKLDPAGAYLWSKVIGSVETQLETGSGIEVAADPNGQIVVLGGTVGDIDVGGGPLVAHGEEDLVLMKFAPDGAHVWSKLLGGPGPERGRDVDIGPDGIILAVGRGSDGADFGGGPLAASGPDALFIATFDP